MKEKLEYYNLIHDKTQIHKFFELLQINRNYEVETDKEKDEVNFISIIARNKYLTKEQKADFKIKNSASMLQRIVCRETTNSTAYLAHILRLNVAKGSYISEGKNIPENILGLYGSYNPCSMKNNLITFMGKGLTTLANAAQNQTALKRLDLIFLSKLYNNKSRKIWIDIDFDIDKEEEHYLLDTFLKYIKANEIVYVVIETRGGFHVLLRKDTLKVNFHKQVTFVHERTDKGEVVINPNNILPIPGTIQGGFPVKIREDL